MMLLLLGWVSELARLASYLRSNIRVSLHTSPGCLKRKIFISEKNTTAFGKREGRGRRVVQEEGEGGCFFSCSRCCREGGLRCGALTSFHRDPWVPPGLDPSGGVFSSAGTRCPAGQGRAGPGSPGPGCLWGAPRGVPPSLARVGEGRRGLFYLRRGAGSGREGKVQAAGGRAPLSPMEGV